MNARIENTDAYAGGEFLLYLDDNVFHAASQHDNERPYSDRNFRADLEIAGQLCRLLCHPPGKRDGWLQGKAMPPLQRDFEIMAQTYPGAHAVRSGSRVLTYGELDTEADALALHLQRQGLLPGGFCLLKLGPSLAQVRVILAVLKAGAAYLQLDPKLPPRHVAAVLDVLRPSMLFVRRNEHPVIDQGGMRVIRCDEEPGDWPFGWPDEAGIGLSTPAHAFATVSGRGGIRMSLLTHQGLAASRQAPRPEHPLPSAAPDPVHFWRILSDGKLLTIPAQYE